MASGTSSAPSASGASHASARKGLQAESGADTVDNDESVGVLTGGVGSDVSASANWPYARVMDGHAMDKRTVDKRAADRHAEERDAPDLVGVDTLCPASPSLPLTEAPIGRFVYLVSQGLRGLLGRRLVDLGFTAGARMRLVRKGPAESLIAVSIRSTVIALRSSEAKSIIVSESRG